MLRSVMQDDEKPKPAFLSKETAEAVPYVSGDPEAAPTFDTEISVHEVGPDGMPGLGVIDRYREIARLHALGKTNSQICKILGYTQAWMSTVLSNPFIQSEIARYRKNLFQQDVADKLKEASRDGVQLLHRTILDDRAKLETRLDAAKWATEKTYGKARQEVSLESGTFSAFMDLLKQMRSQGEGLSLPAAVPEIKDVTPMGPKDDDWTVWIDQNIK